MCRHNPKSFYRSQIKKIVAVDDAGKIVNPLLATGQVHGGLAQGVAQALLEEISYDNDGNPQTANLMDYTAISAMEVPSFDRISIEIGRASCRERV